jgi:hypothetical protein
MELLYDILVEAKRSVEAWGGRLYFVFLPGWDHNRVTGSQREGVLAAAVRAELPVVDLYEAFVTHNDPASLFPFRLPGHYNEPGNRLVAEEVLKAISGRESLR